MYKVQLDSNGNLIAQKVERTDEELVSFSARQLVLHDLTDSIETARCVNIFKYEFVIDYVCQWYVYKNGQKVARFVGIKEKQADLDLYAIAATLLDLEAVIAQSEITSEEPRFFQEDELNEAYCHSPSFLVQG